MLAQGSKHALTAVQSVATGTVLHPGRSLLKTRLRKAHHQFLCAIKKAPKFRV